MKSLICDYIKNHINWEEELSQSPYFLKIKKKDNYVLFMYDQIRSDFYIPLVQEARGIIIDIENKKVVAHAFNKFHNYGEGPAAEIDWSTARVQEKLDGSLIKIWHDKNGWHISSNGTIDAYDAVLDQSGKSLGELVMDLGCISFDTLNPLYTHIFEYVSPYNRVVIDYQEPELYYIGRRNMETGEEEFIPESNMRPRPKEYPISTLADCLRAAAELGDEGPDNVEHEGFVVVDANFHRIKIKSPAYVMAHHIRSKQPTFEDMFDIWYANEVGEFLSTFPAYADVFDFINWCMDAIETGLEVYKLRYTGDRKEFAAQVKKFWYASILFKAAELGIWNFEYFKINYKEQLVRLLKKRWNALKNMEG